MNSTFSSHCTSIASVTTHGDVDENVEIILVEIPLDVDWEEWELHQTIDTVYTVDTPDPLHFFEATFEFEGNNESNNELDYEEDIVENILASLYLHDNGLDE